MCRILLHHAADLGLRIPEDISLILFSARQPDYAFPMDVTRYEMDTPSRAKKALELLLAETPETENREYMFDFIFHKGKTVADLRQK